MELFAVTTGRGPAWDASRSIRERKLWGDHAAFADHSVSSGRILLGGPVESDDPRVVALLAVAADDRAGVQGVFADDP